MSRSTKRRARQILGCCCRCAAEHIPAGECFAVIVRIPCINVLFSVILSSGGVQEHRRRRRSCHARAQSLRTSITADHSHRSQRCRSMIDQRQEHFSRVRRVMCVTPNRLGLVSPRLHRVNMSESFYIVTIGTWTIVYFFAIVE